MTIGITIALVTAACAAVSGCNVCAVYDSSKFEEDCLDVGGHVRTLASRQLCVTDAGTEVSTRSGLEHHEHEEDGG